jgi:hypothetical protein
MNFEKCDTVPLTCCAGGVTAVIAKKTGKRILEEYEDQEEVSQIIICQLRTLKVVVSPKLSNLAVEEYSR